jgi:hypothetical protein
MTRSVLLLLALIAISLCTSQGFLIRPSKSVVQSLGPTSALSMADDADEEAIRLRALGYTDDEIQRSRKKSDKEETKVRVNLIPDVDPLTLTTIGFGLIAFNFFVLANLPGGGIAGVVATIINSIK